MDLYVDNNPIDYCCLETAATLATHKHSTCLARLVHYEGKISRTQENTVEVNQEKHGEKCALYLSDLQLWVSSSVPGNFSCTFLK